MRLIQFLTNTGEKKFGAELKGGESILDLSHIAHDSIDFLKKTEANHKLWDEVHHKIKNAEQAYDENIIKIRDIDRYMAPVTAPDKLICIGMNYKDHCEEQKAPIPHEPIIFNKFPSCIVGPYDPIFHPKDESVTKELDWEVELAVVIGKKGKYIKKEDALDYVAGYTVSMDASARDLQLRRNGGQWLLGKSLDSFCPLGPALVTKDEIHDVHQLDLSLMVNGVRKQDSNTKNIIFKVEELIEYLSKHFTLLPGDVILTGTPPGVGCFRKPAEFLKVGDTVECSIHKIGTIRNEVVQEL